MRNPRQSSLPSRWPHLLLVVLTAGLIGACETAEPNIGATVDEIRENPGGYVGQVVTVSGEIEGTWVPAAFEMNDLLVIVPADVTIKGGPAEITEEVGGDVAQVTGTVQTYAVAEIEAEYGLELPDVEYEEGGPVVVAQTIYLNPAPAANLTGYPSAVVNATVDEVISDRLFFITLGLDDRLLVRLEEDASAQQPVEGQVDINEGQEISLTGTLQPLPNPGMLTSEWGLGPAEADQVDDYTFYYRARQAAGVPETAPGPSE